MIYGEHNGVGDVGGGECRLTIEDEADV